MRRIAGGAACALVIVLSGCTGSHSPHTAPTSSVTCGAACVASKAFVASSAAQARQSSEDAIPQDLNFTTDIVNISFNGTQEEAIAKGHEVCNDLTAGAPFNDVEIGVQAQLTSQDFQDAVDFINAAIASYCPSQDQVEPEVTTSEPPPPPDTITFKVTGNGSRAGVVTYSEGTSIEQATNAHLPWKKVIDNNYDFYQVSAQDANGTSITCEIDSSTDGVLDKHTSTGKYAVVSCSATG